MLSKRKRTNTEDFLNIPKDNKQKFESEKDPLKPIHENTIFLNINDENQDFPSFPYSSNLIKTRIEQKQKIKKKDETLLQSLLEEEHNKINQSK